MDLFTFMTVVLGGNGLSELQGTIIDNWLGPVFIVGVAAFALIFIKDRAWMKLIGFVGIAAIVGVLIFAGDALFGKGGNVTGEAQKIGEQIGQ